MDAKPKRIWKPLTQEQKNRKRARSAAYYAANREKIIAYKAAYRAANREKEIAYDARYYAANRKKILAYRAAYHAANRKKINAKKAAFRAANPLTEEQKQHKKNERRKRILLRKQARLFAGMALLANTIKASQLGGGTHGGLSDGRDAIGRSPMDAGQHSEANQAHAGFCPQP